MHGWVPSVTFSLRKAATNLLLDPATPPALLPAVGFHPSTVWDLAHLAPMSDCPPAELICSRCALGTAGMRGKGCSSGDCIYGNRRICALMVLYFPNRENRYGRLQAIVA